MPLNASFDASVFETIIRVVGGMLAAHDMTGDKVMLERWVEKPGMRTWDVGSAKDSTLSHFLVATCDFAVLQGAAGG
jgi:hypothetical protein